MVYSIIEELINYRDEIDNEFRHWYDLAIKTRKSVGTELNLPHVAKFCSKYRRIVEKDGVLLNEIATKLVGGKFAKFTNWFESI